MANDDTLASASTHHNTHTTDLDIVYNSVQIAVAFALAWLGLARLSFASLALSAWLALLALRALLA